MVYVIYGIYDCIVIGEEEDTDPPANQSKSGTFSFKEKLMLIQVFRLCIHGVIAMFTSNFKTCHISKKEKKMQVIVQITDHFIIISYVIPLICFIFTNKLLKHEII